MTPHCPDGHPSSTEDWCDQCGARIVADPAVAGGGTAGGAGLAAGTGVTGGIEVAGSVRACPECGEPRFGDERYCEGCSYDFVAARRPVVSVAPVEVPEAREPVEVAEPVESGVRWMAEVVADRAFFERGDDGSAVFPADGAARIVELTGTRTLIGRRSRRHGQGLDLDLSIGVADRGVSRTHAMLDHPPDGSLTVTDLGSANGTWVDDARDPVPPGTPVPLAPGARLYLGLWTRINLSQR